MIRRLAPTIVAVVLLALMPAVAIAKPGFYKVPPSRTTLLLPVRGTHGFRVDIAVFDGRPQLTALRGTGKTALSLVVYRQTRQRDDGNDLAADFGAAGRLRARFVPTKTQEEEVPKGCVGGLPILETGYFVGNFKFRGAKDFTSFDAHRIRGIVTRSPGLVCSRGGHEGKRTATGKGQGLLQVIAGTPSANTYFDATAESYVASSRHHEGAVEILESAVILGADPLTIPDLTADLPATMTVKPPAPFTGSATLSAPSRSTATLTGDLAVDLPVTGEVPLTGPGIAAGLCRDYTCTKSLPRALRPRPSEFRVANVELQTIN